MSTFNIVTFGAIPDGQTNSAPAIQAAIDAAHAAGGGTVLVPAGQHFMTGTFSLKSRVRLHLEIGSALIASPDINDYTNWTHIPLFAKSDFCRFWIFTQDATDVVIDGPGTLNANGPAFTIEKRPENTLARNPRAQSLMFLGCQRVRLREFTILDTPSWAIRPAGCDDVIIDGVTILNDLGLVNSDGIDVDCSRRVRITNCYIVAGDDAISVKGRREIAVQYGACEDIIITGCTLVSHCMALRLGLESHVDFRRITASNCTIYASHRGIGIDCRDAGVCEDILFTNIQINTIHSHPVWWHEGEPIYICQVPYVGGGEVAQVRNVRFENIQIRSEQGIYVQGSDLHRPMDITFENVNIHLEKHTAHPGGFFDPRPNVPDFVPAGSRGVQTATPWGSLFQHDIPGFFLDRATGITLRHCRVTWAANLPSYYSHALEAHDVTNLTLDDFPSPSAPGTNLPAQKLIRCTPA
jgi:polygalacturonase